MKKVAFLLVIVSLLMAASLPGAVTAVNAYSGVPSFSIVSVVPDSKVTILTNNFPSGYDFNVLMGAFGTMGVGGTKVAVTSSGAGGALQATYTIPDGLKGANLIAIRLESTTGGFFAYNWFYNVTSSTTPGTGGPVYTGIPTFSITDVVVDSKVSIKTNNFPQDLTFKVLMGKYGTLGIGGVEVTTTNSGEGGTFTATYDIPSSLKGESRIAIRMESTTGGYFAYNWFTNATSSTTPGTGGPVYTGIPTFTIQSVVANSKVTIKTNNFPQDTDFKILIGAYGTLGIGGTQVATENSAEGGVFTSTYDIPAAFNGAAKLAIRMESLDGRYYAYNWFYNTTNP